MLEHIGVTIEEPATCDANEPASPDHGGLTNRQYELALLLAVGNTTAEAAAKMTCNQKTCDSHRARIMKQLGVRNNVELAREALRRGWVTL